MSSMGDKYWYARGYYDGRVHGSRKSDGEVSTLLDDSERLAYKHGYDVGVTDFCDLDCEEYDE